jgi:hypothetical protein
VHTYRTSDFLPQNEVEADPDTRFSWVYRRKYRIVYKAMHRCSSRSKLLIGRTSRRCVCRTVFEF